MSCYLRRKSLVLRMQRIGNKQWHTFSEGFVQPGSLFKDTVIHAVLFLSCLLLSRRSLLLPSLTVQVWPLCFSCYYYQITAYVPPFSFSFNIKVSANLWLGLMPSLNLWIASFYHFCLCLLPSVQEPSVWMTVSVEQRMWLHCPFTMEYNMLLGHPINLWWTILAASVRCSSLVHFIPSKVLGLHGSEHRDRYVRNASEVGYGHSSNFEGSPQGHYNCSHISWHSPWAAYSCTRNTKLMF